jgi:hypothetical protein
VDIYPFLVHKGQQHKCTGQNNYKTDCYLHSNLQSLHLWQLFTKRGTSESPVTRTHKTTTCHHIPISLLATSISCSPTSYLTSLTLVSSITDTTSSLHCLSTLPNLVSLNINGSSSSANQTSMINDDTIRLWNKKARLDKTVFSYLKSLFLRFQPGVTEKALAELSHFPKLEMVVTSRCGVNIPNAKSIIKDRGWKMSKYVSFLAFPPMLPFPSTSLPLDICHI